MKRAICAAALLVIAACRHHDDSLPYIRSATMTPEWLSEAEAASPSMHRVAHVSLRDQAGSPIDSTALDGRVTIVQFFSARCGDVCPLTHQRIARVLRELPDDARVQVLSYSVTPERDSVPALQAYAEMRRITDSRWHLLTGAKSDIEHLARDAYFVRLGRDTTFGVDSISHTETLLLIDQDRRIRGAYAGTLDLEARMLLADTRRLLTRTSTAQRPTTNATIADES